MLTEQWGSLGSGFKMVLSAVSGAATESSFGISLKVAQSLNKNSMQSENLSTSHYQRTQP